MGCTVLKQFLAESPVPLFHFQLFRKTRKLIFENSGPLVWEFRFAKQC